MKVAIKPYTTLAETADLIRTREVSPVEVVETHLERIAEIDPKINAFITVTADLAREQAKEAEAEIASGTYRGPLHGIPFSLKDMYFTEGILSSAHSFVLENFIPEVTATPVTKMYEAGAVLLGKCATMEFATGAVTEGPWPPAKNPWNTDWTPAGSSSGSGASLAAGMGLASLGGDTGGSIRAPAAYCGVVGIRSTYGRVSRWGSVALSWSQDVCGPLAMDVRDCALILNAVAGHDPKDAASAKLPVPDFTAGLGSGVAGLRIGVDEEHFFHDGVHPDVKKNVEAALKVLEGLGATLVPLSLPMLDYAHDAQNIIHMSETHTYHEQRIKTTPQLYGPTVRAYFRLGSMMTAPDYLNAQRVRNKVRNQMVRALHDKVDLIAAPTMSQPGEKFADLDTSKRFSNLTGRGNLTVPFSQAGVPAISVPCGFSSEGLPTALQIAGKPFDEVTVLRGAHAYEQATDWHTMHPEL